MASAPEPTSVKSRPPSVGSGRKTSRRNLFLLSILTLSLASACVFGLFFDRSIRTDPFTKDPGLWQWLSKPQPHEDLAIMPVLPMGPAGVLSWRPRSTQWIAEKSNVRPASPPPRSAAEAFGIGSAFAGEAPPGKPPRKPGGGPAEETATKAVDQTLRQQIFRPPGKARLPDAKETQPAMALVPDPKTLEKFSQLPPRATLPANAYWAGCDTSGRVCSCVQGSEYLLSSDGGLRWDPDTGQSNKSAPLRAPAGGSSFVFNGTPPIEQISTGSSTPQSAIDPQLPFALAEYSIGNQPRGFRISTTSNSADRIVREYLRLTGSTEKLNFFGVLPQRADAGLGDESYTVFVLFSDGQGLRAHLRPSDGNAGQILHDTRFFDNLKTRANLRSLHFQRDGIGWMSSGWNDGNEEGVYPAVFQTKNGGDDWERLSYRALPAPWVLYFALPSLVVAFFFTGVAWRESRPEDAKPGIADIGTSDAPIGWQDRDVLGLKPLALSLSRFIRNTSTVPPLTLAITGAWGTGKSSLMNLVAEDLRGRGATPVWFNAWHHQKEENILAALLENIRAQAIPSAWTASGLAFRARLFGSRSFANIFPLLLIATGLAILAYFFDPRALVARLGDLNSLTQTRIEKSISGVAGAGVGALVILMIKLYATLNLKPSELMATLRKNARLADFSTQLSFRYKFAIEFNDAAKALRTSTNPGLVIFIDDLDRCSSDNLMAVLESINFLTTAGPCFILLGMDGPKIVEIVARQYDNNEERARQYLKKLINLTVPVPEVNETNSIHLSAGSDPGVAPSAWPKRIRSALRDVPNAAAPALILIAAILIGVAWLPPIAPADKPDQPASQETTPTAPVPAPDSSITTPTPAPARDSPAVVFPTVKAEQLAPHRRIQPFIGVGLAVLIVALLIARRITLIREDKVEDSEDFRAALGIWHPAVFAADPTPRGVKRHQNRLRLQAMRLRPLHEEPDLLDSWFSVTAQQKGGASSIPDISEPKLVALSGIAALLGDIPAWSTEDGPADPDKPLAKAAAVIVACRIHFKKHFPRDWPPTSDDINAFRDLRQSL
jgi:hypothetical protein